MLYNFPPLTDFPDVLELNLSAENCPKQLLSTEESVYELLTTLDTSKSTGCDGVSAEILSKQPAVLLFHSQILLIFHSQPARYHTNGKWPE